MKKTTKTLLLSWALASFVSAQGTHPTGAVRQFFAIQEVIDQATLTDTQRQHLQMFKDLADDLFLDAFIFGPQKEAFKKAFSDNVAALLEALIASYLVFTSEAGEQPDLAQLQKLMVNRRTIVRTNTDELSFRLARSPPPMGADSELIVGRRGRLRNGVREVTHSEEVYLVPPDGNASDGVVHFVTVYPRIAEDRFRDVEVTVARNMPAELERGVTQFPDDQPDLTRRSVIFVPQIKGTYEIRFSFEFADGQRREKVVKVIVQ